MKYVSRDLPVFQWLSRAIVFSVIIVFSCGTLAAEISPGMLMQAQSLSVQDREALAKQYGFDLSLLNKQSSATQMLALPSEPMVQDPRVQEYSKRRVQSFAQQKPAVLKRFGEDLFDQVVSTFSVTDNALVPNDYRLGTGDEVKISFYGKENSDYSLEIGRNGEIQLPKIGPLVLAGLQFEDARDLIQQQVRERLIGVEAVVSIGRMRAISIFMAGEVLVPGSYSVSALSTVSQALFVAGGVSSIGSLRHIQVKRASETIAVFDAYDLLLHGEVDQDIRLQSGDVVFVPPYDRLAVIEGEVKRPMAYELANSDTVTNLVMMAGGYARDAYPAGAVLMRKAQGKELPTVLNVDLATTTAAVDLYDGDTLRIPTAANTYANAVEIQGAAVRPGIYAWYEGARVSDLLPSIKGDLLPTVDVDYALIVREKNRRLEISVKQFNIGDAILHPGTSADPLLEPRDKLVLFELVDLAALTAAERGIISEAVKTRRQENFEPDRLNRDVSSSLSAAQMASRQGSAQGVHRDLHSDSYQSRYEDSYRNENGDARLDEYFDEASDLSHRLAIDSANAGNQESKNVTREVLLAPILNKLRSQAGQGQPVQIVSVSGAVKAPGDYPLEPGDRVYDLVRAAGGLRDSVYLPAAEFRRIVSQGSGAVESRYQELSFEYLDDADNPNNLLLQSRDHLMVRSIPDWSPTAAVKISGEVRFPGEYLIRRGETLSQVVARAGGLTVDAFPQGAVFTRVDIAKLETERAVEFANSIKNSFAASLLTQELKTTDFTEVETITQTLADFRGKGRMLVNVEAALTGNQSADVVVVAGDQLLIPAKTSTITVIGEVRRQGTHAFQSQFDVKDYVSLSAGMTARADKKEVYIVKADGSVVMPGTSWSRFGSPRQRLSPGDSIVVPIDGTYKDKITQWRDVTQILYQSAITVAAVIAL